MRLNGVLLLALLCTVPVSGQKVPTADANEGIVSGWDGEWRYVSRLLVMLAEAIPADKYGWRPAPGVRSVSETIMHVAVSNYYLLDATGRPMPAGMGPETERTVVAKAEVVGWLKRSLEAVRVARSGLKPGDLERKIVFEGHAGDVGGLYLRMLAHANEHLGQLIAYARMNGVVPPWSAR